MTDRINNLLNIFIRKLFAKQQRLYGSSTKKIKELTHKHQNPFPPKILQFYFDIKIEKINGFDCYVVTGKNKKKNTHTIATIYIHGGAYVYEISIVHWLHIRNIIDKTNCTMYVPIYPLSKENYSSQLDSNKFLLQLYKNICNKYEHINIFGDSAGGNLALILAQQVKKEKLVKPSNVILFSPLVSFDIENEMEKEAKSDPILPLELLKTVSQWQLGNHSAKSELFSPIHGDSKNIGNISIFVGEKEFFLIQIKEYCEDLETKKIPFTLHIEKNMYHDYPIFMITKEANRSNKKLYSLINNS